MSFSFSFRARTVAAAAAIAAIEMDRVVAQQPVHAADRDQVLANVQNQLGVIAPGAAGMHVTLNVNGSLSWRGTAAGTATPQSADFAITHANANVSAGLIAEDATGDYLPALREAPEA